VRLGINGWRLQGQRTGVARYLLNTVRHWTGEAVAGRFDEVTFYTPKALDRRENPLPGNVRERVLRSNSRMLVWENVRLGPVATDDVLFCPSFSIPLLQRGKTVVTTHEATVAILPEMYPPAGRLFYRRLYGWSARHATLVLTHTEAARQDIARCYGVPLDRIRVVPLAPAALFQPVRDDARMAAVRAKYLGSASPMFLFVGKLTARRNVPKLMQAFAELKHRHGLPHKLLVIGLNTTNLDLAGLARDLEVAADFHYLAYVPDEDLNLIYNAAEVFVMPYTYESNSLTTLEAQATGTPVITADTSGLSEVTGGAGTALLISRAEVPEIGQAMLRIATEAGLRRELAEKGLAHARRFTWARSSAETLAVLEEAAKTSAPALDTRAAGKSAR